MIFMIVSRNLAQLAMHRGLILLLVVVLRSSPAYADHSIPIEERSRARFADGMVLEIQYGRLRIKRGNVDAPLPFPEGISDYKSPVETLKEVRESEDHSWVTVEFSDGCGKEERFRLLYTALAARIENAAAMGAYHKKDYSSAISGFSRALKQDPTFDMAATNLASAYVRSGKIQEALRALAPLVVRNPAQLYFKCLTDSDLSSLLESPEISGLRSVKPGNARLDLDRVAGGGQKFSGERYVVYSSARGLVGAIRFRVDTRDQSDDPICPWESSLTVTTVDGKNLAEFPLVTMRETADNKSCGQPTPLKGSVRQSVESRVLTINRMLAALGFVVPEQQEAQVVPPIPNTLAGDSERKFPGSSLKLTGSLNGPVKLLEGDSLLDSLAWAENISWAVYVPSIRVIVFQWGQHYSEGCPKNVWSGVKTFRIADLPHDSH